MVLKDLIAEDPGALKGPDERVCAEVLDHKGLAAPGAFQIEGADVLAAPVAAHLADLGGVPELVEDLVFVFDDKARFPKVDAVDANVLVAQAPALGHDEMVPAAAINAQVADHRGGVLEANSQIR